MSSAWGCAIVFGGIVVGVVAAVLIFLLLAALAGSLSNRVYSLLLVAADLVAIGLAFRVIWLARRGPAPALLFLVGLTVALAGLLCTCSALMFSMGNFNFH